MRDIVSAQADSLLVVANGFLERGYFLERGLTPPEEGDSYVGIATLYERALFSAGTFFAEQMKRELETAKEIGDVNMGKLDGLLSKSKACNDFAWASLRARLREAPERLSIREGWKIVGRPVVERKNPLELLMSALTQPSSPDKVHDCDNCDYHEICDDPQKKARAGTC